MDSALVSLFFFQVLSLCGLIVLSTRLHFDQQSRDQVMKRLEFKELELKRSLETLSQMTQMQTDGLKGFDERLYSLEFQAQARNINPEPSYPRGRN
jgi:hypothetical protein